MIGRGSWPPPDHPHRDQAEMYVVGVIAFALVVMIIVIMLSLYTLGIFNA